MPQTVDTETESMLRESVRAFVKKEVAPIAKKIDREDQFPVEVFRKMGKLGFLGVTIPEEYGGSAMGYRAQGIIEEELGYASASLGLSYGAHSNLCMDSIYRNGSPEIRETYLPKLCSGEWIGSLCLTEPESGSDALAMKTHAEKADGGWKITGSKTLITNAPLADIFVVYAKTGDSLSAFVALATDSGLSRGKKFDKMGMRGSPTGELFFDSMYIPDNRTLGAIGVGKDIIMSGLNLERVILSFIFIGLARRGIEMSVQYASSRKQGGKPIGDRELIQEKLAYMYTRYETSKMLCYRAVDEVSKDPMNVLSAASCILYTTEAAEYIAREALQIWGGMGYVSDSEVERLLRDAVLGQIGAGTTEIRKKLVGHELIKNYVKNGRLPE
ncbi:MAG: acyl-CoA dehydrogenase family protein [Candidatus Thermoplasmatota archaeon]|jgi:isovaleryl-CoA dehydrogenase|nr:acyl-CoA dehydrogenase family protein [Candidatus Thermoplasmatota archaeon]MCL5785085.1 acyl-CoA dehydrogenase family protein [Candidatus Thermoplasmatota archaeon]